MFAQALTLAALAGAVAAQSSLKINTPPALTLCEPSLITWEGGAAPYIISVIPGGQQSAAALKYLSQGTNDHQYTWKIDIESGTQVTLKVLDNTGLAAFSAPVSIQGTDRSCLGGGEENNSSSEAPAPEASSEAPAPEASSEAPEETPSAEATPSAEPSAEASSAEPSPSAAASPSSSAAASPSAAAPSSSSASSSTSSRAAATSTSATTSKAEASPSATQDSGAKANVASFGILAAAGALAALF